MKAAHGKGHTLKHARRHVKHHHKGVKHHPHHVKHHATKHKHHVHAKAKHATHAKAKGLALPGDVACCTIEALAASLLSQGLPVTGADVLALFRAAGGDEDKGMPISAALEAAAEHGLAGHRLLSATRCEYVPRIQAFAPEQLILGVELPGQHTVLATPDGWWSWGELYCPWCEFGDVVIDEAWAVTWA